MICYLLISILYLIITSLAIFNYTITDLQYWSTLVVSVICLIAIYYLLVFLKINRTNKNMNFVKVKANIREIQKQLHIQDIELLKEIFKEQNINTRAEVQEVIRHYQCLIPRKTISSGTMLSILAFTISTMAFIFNETTNTITTNVNIFLSIMAIVVIVYFLLKFINDNTFKLFGKYALYERLESSASEIYMTMQIAKKKEQDNG